MAATVALDAIRDCLEGAAPGVIATCAADGTPNVSYLSQVQYVDRHHVALSFQFFNKTRANVLANPRARLMVVHPVAGTLYRLAVEYLRTESEGPLFESMRAKLASIASHTGMADVFRLLGADVYRVTGIEAVHGAAPGGAASFSRLAALRAASARVLACADLESLFAATLAALHEHFEVHHAMFLLVDAAAGRLYTVASLGYPASGVGSEIPLGAGVIGVAAREGAPIRLFRLAADYSYARAIRDSAVRAGIPCAPEKEIPFAGLAESRSQLAVPIPVAGRTAGVLFVESPLDLRFGYDDEDALVAFAAQVGQAMHLLQLADEREGHAPEAAGRPPRARGKPVTVRHYAADDSIFLGDDYLIKGVAGAVFWTLVSDYANGGRIAFTNRELRLDPRVRLPDIGDNLEARLVLLQRRLVEREACVRIERTGRGRFSLRVSRPLQLVQIDQGA
ncbi:MAG: GAF domain-containing protein [Burkholderiaceae bacterium]|nr:GAF domain-containing protein [Burkholderiaceae bacterium]